ncbi:amidase [Methylobacterium brachythecii]|nr:amidase [Methylobacterium brachythecii]MBB3903030.1 amidase [Methylobacterium brachythecii]
MEAHTLGLVEAARAIRDGRLDGAAYRAALVERIRRIDPEIRAFTCLADPDDAATGAGPLAGIPVAVKDIFATSGLPTTNGSQIYADRIPDADAWVVERLRSLGASVLGKTVTTEFAWRHAGPTRNPWNTAHTPGGSSSGSAAAVAAGLAPLALGSQTFGSVIRPAAFCGVVGLKPSYGAIPRIGVHPLAPSLDHVGVFTRSVADAAFALSLLTAVSDADPHGRPLPGFSLDTALAPLPAPRLAFVRTSQWDVADTSQKALTETAAARFGAAGGVVEDVVLPASFVGMWEAARTILACEASAIFGPLAERYPDLMSAVLKELVAEGAAIAAPAYIDALRLQAQLREELGTVLVGFDAILTLPAAGPAPEGLDYTGNPAFCVPWTFLGVPAVNLPAGLHDGMPLGIQLVGRYRDDLHLLRVAAWCETILDHHTVPSLAASGP